MKRKLGMLILKIRGLKSIDAYYDKETKVFDYFNVNKAK